MAPMIEIAKYKMRVTWTINTKGRAQEGLMFVSFHLVRRYIDS